MNYAIVILVILIGMGFFALYVSKHSPHDQPPDPSPEPDPEPEPKSESPKPEPLRPKPPESEDAFRDLFKTHLYVLGMTGQGKSTTLTSLVMKDISRGFGVCVIDPKGDMVKHIVEWVPQNRVADTIYLDLNRPVPIDLLAYRTDDEREALVGEIKHLITRGENVDHAPLMQAVMDDLINTLLEYNTNVNPDQRATFLDVLHFLEDRQRQKTILAHVRNPRLLRRWTDNFPNDRTVASITGRMTPFVNSRTLRTVFECPNPKLNIQDVMEQSKVLLVDLGGISEPKKILGTLLVAQIRQCAFRRANIPESQRKTFCLFVDEFQYFQTSDFAQILSVARGYGLRLTLSNQFVGQLEGGIRDAIFGNVGNYIIFRIGPRDAPYFKHFFPKPDPSDPREHFDRLFAKYGVPSRAHPTEDALTKLPEHHAFWKMADGSTCIAEGAEPPPFRSATPAESIKKRTVDNYACNTMSQELKERSDEERGQRGKTEDIPPSSEPRVSPFWHKKKNP